MEFSTLIGLLSSLALVTAAIMLGGKVGAFVDVPSFLIVLCGTVTVTLSAFSGGEVARAAAIGGRVLVAEVPSFNRFARHLLGVAQKARQQGLLGIQKEAAAEAHPFLRQALSLAVDGAPPETVERILHQDTLNLMDRHERALAVLRRAAEVAPSMGLIGTLIGLVQMLGSLSNPSTIGPAMAVAILTTFYGAMLSYVILTPLCSKVEKAGAEDLLTRKLVTTTVLSILRQENPRQLELHLNAILPPSQRTNVFK